MSRIEDIVYVLMDLGDTISLISSDSELAQVAKTSNLDFYKFRNEIVSLVRHGVRTGYTKPATCRMEIRKTDDKDVFSVKIEVYFLVDEGKFQKISKQYSVFGFSYIPNGINEILEKNGLAKVTFNASEIQDIVMNMEKEVYDSRNRPLSYWIKKTIKESSNNDHVRYRVKLDDIVLYYRARLYSLSANNDEQYITDFMVAHLINLDALIEKSDIEALRNAKTVYFDVTKS